MKKHYKFTYALAIGLLLGFNLIAQERVVVVEPSNDLNLNEFINADTLANGEWVDTLNTVYELKRNSVYLVSKQIDVRGTKLHIRGQEGDGQKPVIAMRIKEDGTFNKLLYTRGDAIIENVRLTAEESAKNYSWNAIRIMGNKSTVIFRNCIVEKQGGAFAALYGENVSLTIERCEGRFFGQPTRVTGNGRIVDGRKSSDYVKIVDCVFYNVMSVCFSGWGNHHKYVEFDHNTFVNMACENRLFQFNNIVDSVKVTNNIFMNCFFAGDYPNKMLDDKAADAKHGDNPGTLAFFFAPDSLPPNKDQWMISNNNVFFTENLADSMATYPDTIIMPPVISPNFAGWLGDATSDVFFEEALEFPSAPETPTWVWKNRYNDPDLTEHGYFVPVHPAVADSNWYKFDVNSIDVSYDINSISATAGTDGSFIGSRLYAPTGVVIGVNEMKKDLQITPYPNPAKDQITFKFNEGIGSGNITIYSITGAVQASQEIHQQDDQLKLDLSSYADGIYLYKIATDRLKSYGKFAVK
jgi:hypothetical protein